VRKAQTGSLQKPFQQQLAIATRFAQGRAQSSSCANLNAANGAFSRIAANGPGGTRTTAENADVDANSADVLAKSGAISTNSSDANTSLINDILKMAEHLSAADRASLADALRP
jgi:hypothetical protein